MTANVRAQGNFEGTKIDKSKALMGEGWWNILPNHFFVETSSKRINNKDTHMFFGLHGFLPQLRTGQNLKNVIHVELFHDRFSMVQ